MHTSNNLTLYVGMYAMPPSFATYCQQACFIQLNVAEHNQLLCIVVKEHMCSCADMGANITI